MDPSKRLSLTHKLICTFKILSFATRSTAIHVARFWRSDVRWGDSFSLDSKYKIELTQELRTHV